MLFVLALFAASSLGEANSNSVAACVARIDQLSIGSEVRKAEIPALVGKYCRSQGWLTNLFQTNRDFYDAWVAREQVRFIVDDVLSSVALRECFRHFADSEFKGNQEVNARAALDLLAEINAYRAIPTPSERALGACRLWRGFIKARAEFVPAGANVGITPLVQREVQAAVKADTNDICTLSGNEATPELFAPAEEAVRAALKNAHVPEDFLASAAFKSCAAAGRVERDINSFQRIEKLYCADEESAYDVGTPERRTASERAVRDGWTLECAKNPDFFPEEITDARSRPRPQ